MLTREELKMRSQRWFEQHVREEVESKLNGVTPELLDSGWYAREYQELVNMLAEEMNVLLVKHGFGGTQADAPVRVTTSQWSNLVKQNLQLAASKGVSQAELDEKEPQHRARAEAIWDGLFELGMQEAKSRGVSEAQLDAFRKDPQLYELRKNFTEGVAGVVCARVCGRGPGEEY